MSEIAAVARVSKVRRRAVNEALALIDEVRLPRGRRRHVADRIRQARSPRAEAKKLIAGYLRASIAIRAEAPDFSDVQELRVKLIRRDYWLDPQVSRLLTDLDRAVVRGLTRAEFHRRAELIVKLRPTLPVAWRKAEAAR